MTGRTLWFSVAAVLLFAGLAMVEEKEKFTADRHKDLGISCEACHGEAKPTTAAPADKCLTCHKSMEAVDEKTKDFVVDPHNNHITQASDIECTQCHHGHKIDVPVCEQCHSGFKFAKSDSQQ